MTHRAYCDALTEENARLSNAVPILSSPTPTLSTPPLNYMHHLQNHHQAFSLLNTNNQDHHLSWDPPLQNPTTLIHIKPEATFNNIDHNLPNATTISEYLPFMFYQQPNTLRPSSSYNNFMTMTTTSSPFRPPPPPFPNASSMNLHIMDQLGGLGHVTAAMNPLDCYRMENFGTWQQRSGAADYMQVGNLTRDFLGLTGDHRVNRNANEDVNVNVNVNLNGRNVVSFTRGLELPNYVHPLLRNGFVADDIYSDA